MKTPKYKFDELWLKAISRCNDLHIPGVEYQVRRYIETGENVDDLFFGSDFECAWVLMKAEIDRRKARNERARERRRQRREEIERKKREAEAMAQAAALREREEMRIAEENARIERAGCKKQDASPRRDSGVSSRGTGSAPTGVKAPKSRFSYRFRGPGLSGGGNARFGKSLSASSLSSRRCDG